MLRKGTVIGTDTHVSAEVMEKSAQGLDTRLLSDFICELIEAGLAGPPPQEGASC